MIIHGGTVISGDFRTQHADIQFDNGIITAVGRLGGDSVFDAHNCLVMPGFIDTHVHGAAGGEFASADGSFKDACAYEAEHGVTTLLPTVRCIPKDEIIAAEKNILREMRKNGGGSRIAGIHLEGPFVNPKYCGGMVTDYMLPPTAAVAEEFASAGEGCLKIITLAPELDGANECIKKLTSLGVKVSMGHTGATYAQAKAAAEAGACRVTHTYNAMRPMHHREMGILGFALTDKSVACEMICDLVHLSAPAIMLLYRSRGAEKITMVSDSGVFAGLPDGEYVILGRKRIVKDGECHLENGTIAGSCKTLYHGVRNLLDMGIPPQDVAKMASLNPAKAAGIENSVGSLAPGKNADIVVLDENHDIKAVFLGGERIK